MTRNMRAALNCRLTTRLAVTMCHGVILTSAAMTMGIDLQSISVSPVRNAHHKTLSIQGEGLLDG